MHVVGVLAAKGQSSYGQDQDDLVMIPFTTGEQKVLVVVSPSQARQSERDLPATSEPL